MAPSTTSPKQLVPGRRESRRAGNSREATPRPGTALALKAKSDAQLATSFKTDLNEIRTLITCTICDQLLYEPWTLGCGHTYCYTCLCSWFTTNRRTKTCPECRAKVTVIPAPNFLVKQMVDQVFTKRRELMPADETIEQHVERGAEEIASVENDRNHPEGLFKGLFQNPRAILFRDEADGGILRCPGCGHEHEGGPDCAVCGLRIEDPYGFSDIDDEDLDELSELEHDLDMEIQGEYMDEDSYINQHHHGHLAHNHFARPFLDVAAQNNQHRHIAHLNPYHQHHPGSDPSDSDDQSSLVNGDSDDSDNSLNDFVVQDDVPPNRPANRNNSGSRRPINLLSDDESDEGGAISNRRPRQRTRASTSPNRGGSRSYPPSESPDAYYADRFRDPDRPAGPGSVAVTVTDTDTNGSEAGDQAELLRHAGWSPLDHGNDSDAEGVIPPYYTRGRYGTSTDDQDDSDHSDTATETATENGHNDEDDHSREGFSESPVPFQDHYQRHIQAGREFGRQIYELEDDDIDDGDSELNRMTDNDGDTDMTPSSPASGDSRRTNLYYSAPSPRGESEDYGDQTPRGERGVSINSTDSSSEGGPYDGMYQSNRTQHQRFNNQRTNHQRSQQLGCSNAIHHVEADSSDSSIRPPHGRRNTRPQSVASVQQQYDPRISMMFAEHQAAAARGSRENLISFEDWEESEDEVHEIEPASSLSRHPARRMTAYRNMPARRDDPLRSSRSPSSTRVISSSQRNSRLPRQYSRRW